MNIEQLIQRFDEFTADYKVKFNGINVFPYLRYYTLNRLGFKKEMKATGQSPAAKNILQNFFYGFLNWFKRYDAVVFMASSDRKLYQGKWTEKTDFLPQHLGKTLFVELPDAGHYSFSAIPSKFVVSKIPLLVAEKILALFVISPKKVQQLEKNVNQEFNSKQSGMAADYKQFVARYWVSKFWFWWWGVKTGVFDAAYVDMPRVMALKNRKNNKAIEFQHGLISRTHYGYQLFNSIHPQLCPDYFLTFGDGFKKIMEGSHLYDSEQIYSVGSFYLDVLNGRSINIPEINELKKKYKCVIAISGQDPVDDLSLPFYQLVAEKRPEWCFVFSPRSKNVSRYKGKSKLGSGIYLLPKYGVYEIISNCHLHSTVYSTCALEAGFLGKANVLYDLNSLASQHLGEFLGENKTVSFAQNEEEFIEGVQIFLNITADAVKKENSWIIKPGYENNLAEFFRSKF